MLSNVLCTSNGDVKYCVLYTKFAYACGWACLNHDGKMKEKNGNLSSCLPWRVLRMSANLQNKNNTIVHMHIK